MDSYTRMQFIWHSPYSIGFEMAQKNYGHLLNNYPLDTCPEKKSSPYVNYLPLRLLWRKGLSHFLQKIKHLSEKISLTSGHHYWLVPTPLKNISQHGNLPQMGVEINVWNHLLDSLVSLVKENPLVRSFLLFVCHPHSLQWGQAKSSEKDSWFAYPVDLGCKKSTMDF